MTNEPTSFERVITALEELSIAYFVLPTNDIRSYRTMKLTSEQEAQESAAEVYIIKRKDSNVWIFVGQHRGKSFGAERMKTLVSRLESAETKEEAIHALLDIPG